MDEEQLSKKEKDQAFNISFEQANWKIETSGNPDSNSIKEDEPIKVEKEDLLPTWTGNFGIWQIGTFLMLSLLVVVHAWQMLCMKFLSFPVDHWCARPEKYASLTIEEWRNISAPVIANKSMVDRCNMGIMDWNDSIEITEKPVVIKCDTWEYNDSNFDETIQERWDLVCGKSFLPRISQTVFFCGNMVGALFCGAIADLKGRKFTMFLFLIAVVISGLISSFADNYILWTVARFLVGASTTAMDACITVYIVENCSSKYRAIYHAFTNSFFWATGHMTLSPLVYLIHNMKHLEWFLTGCYALFIPLVYFFVLESPRWLLATKRFQRSQSVIGRICKINGRTFNPEDVFNYKEDKVVNEKGSMKELLTHPGLRKNFFMMCFTWFSFSFGYYGMLYNTPSTQGNVYMVFMLTGFLSMCMVTIMPFMQQKFGRKAVMTLSLLLAGVLILCSIAISKENTILLTILCGIGILGCGCSFDTGYLFTKELFPTVLRTTVLTTASASARFGAIFSPIIGGLDIFDPSLPLLVYGVVVIIAALQSILIWPETLGLNLPDSIEESEMMTKSTNTWLTCCQRKANKKTNRELAENLTSGLIL